MLEVNKYIDQVPTAKSLKILKVFRQLFIDLHYENLRVF